LHYTENEHAFLTLQQTPNTLSMLYSLAHWWRHLYPQTAAQLNYNIKYEVQFIT